MASFDQKTPAGLKIAQAIGITASTYLLGQNVSLSVAILPAVMQAPAPIAAKQWATIFTRTGSFAIPLAITSALATGYVAYHQDPQSLAFKLNAAATVLVPSIMPFTLFLIMPTNKKLMARKDALASTALDDKAAEAGIAEAETTNALIDRWGVLNLARAVLIAAGSLCTIVAALDKREFVGVSRVSLSSGANRLG